MIRIHLRIFRATPMLRASNLMIRLTSKVRHAGSVMIVLHVFGCVCVCVCVCVHARVRSFCWLCLRVCM
jgi:hypothetical protein